MIFTGYLTLIAQSKDSVIDESDGRFGESGFQDQWDYVTDRNWPTVKLDTFAIVECRQLDKQPFNITLHYSASNYKNLTDPTSKRFEELTAKD